MEPHSVLNSQKIPSRSRAAWSRKIFTLIFMVSIGLNIYFILHNNPDAPAPLETATEVAAKSEPVPVAPLPAVPVPAAVDEAAVEKKTPAPALPVAPRKKTKLERVEVKRASFSSQDFGEGKEIHALHFKVRNSLSFSTCRIMQEGCEQMSAYISRLLVWFFDVESNMRNGDSVHLVYEKLDSEERFKILKLVYKSEFAGKTFQANFYRTGELDYGVYYDQEGKEIARRIAGEAAPIQDYQEITSLPGDFRGDRGGHAGTDFKAEVGTPIFSSFEGKVTRTNWNIRSNGYCVEIDHPREGVKTLYLHLSRVLVKPGLYVKKGQKIAESGNTGRTFAPHLHYEIKGRGKRKRIYNPFEFKHLTTFNREIPTQHWEDFVHTVRLYDQALNES